jgi:hypothetical protein
MQLLKEGMHSLKEEMAVWVALFLTVVFVISLGIIFYFLSTTSMGDPTWGHYAYLLAALQAVTAGAVGWLFGSQVHRGEVKMAAKGMTNAESHAVSAEQRASTAEQSTMQGKVLAAQVMAHAQLMDSMASSLPQNPAQAAVDAHMKQLVAQVEMMYPDMAQGIGGTGTSSVGPSA